MKRRVFFVVAISIAMAGVLLSNASFAKNDTRKWVGAKAQNQFENGWLGASTYRHNTCGYFVVRMDEYADSVRKYFTVIEGARWRYVEGQGEGYGYGIDNVDIYMNCSHGGTDGDVFITAMWDEDDWVESSEMRLGDDGRQLSIYTSYDCSQMENDGDQYERWSHLFEGGLRFASAFWDSSYNSSSTQYFGRHYANYLHDGMTLRYAWLNSMDDYSLNRPAIMTTGYTSSDCSWRRQWMTWENHDVQPRYRDSQVNNYCMTRRQP